MRPSHPLEAWCDSGMSEGSPAKTSFELVYVNTVADGGSSNMFLRLSPTAETPPGRNTVSACRITS